MSRATGASAGRGAGDALAHERVRADELELGGVERSRLRQDLLRHGELADVVQPRAHGGRARRAPRPCPAPARCARRAARCGRRRGRAPGLRSRAAAASTSAACCSDELRALRLDAYMRSSAARSTADAVVFPGSRDDVPARRADREALALLRQRVVRAREQQRLLHAGVDDREDAELVAAHPVRAGGRRDARRAGACRDARAGRRPRDGRSGRCSP